MGAMLSEPKVEKTSSSGKSKRFVYATSEMQGWRTTMEDAHLCNLNLVKGADPESAFFAVFDGHGGRSVACCASTRLDSAIVAEPDFAKGQYADALRSAFFGLDETLKTVDEVENQPSGSTCISALFIGDEIYVANAGDSRAVLSSGGATVPMSFDHKPTCEKERARIEKSGGFVEFNRVNGNLALSRAFGDYEFKTNRTLPPKDQTVTVDPEIIMRKMAADDEFLILACDGIWDCVTNEQCVEYIRYQLAKGCELVEACERLMDQCLSVDAVSEVTGVGCDNMTVVLVAILGNRTDTEWFQWMTSKYAHLANGPCPIAPRRASADTVSDCQIQPEFLQQG